MYDNPTVPPPTMLSEVEPSKEQREQLLRLEILKRWEIKIQPLDRGCVVSFGYKNVGFEDIDIAMGTIREYFDKPAKVLTELGFDKDLL